MTMGIQFYNGLNNYAGINNYRMDIPKADPKDIAINANPVKEQPRDVKESISVKEAQETEKQARIASLEDISLTFNKEEDFEYLNNDSSVKSLDMEKAISDMHKDTILQEYQYFVGSSKQLFNDSDGIVIAKN